jgi:hypothetical protein
VLVKPGSWSEPPRRSRSPSLHKAPSGIAPQSHKSPPTGGATRLVGSLTPGNNVCQVNKLITFINSENDGGEGSTQKAFSSARSLVARTKYFSPLRERWVRKHTHDRRAPSRGDISGYDRLVVVCRPSGAFVKFGRGLRSHRSRVGLTYVAASAASAYRRTWRLRRSHRDILDPDVPKVRAGI